MEPLKFGKFSKPAHAMGINLVTLVPPRRLGARGANGTLGLYHSTRNPYFVLHTPGPGLGAWALTTLGSP
jgi:hypothetical protein